MAAHTKIDLYQMQSLPLDTKIRMTARRIDAFIDRNDAYISISGGKDSRVLDDIERRFVRAKLPRVFIDTGLEHRSVRACGKRHADIILRPEKNFKQIITEYGYPVISKEVAQTIAEARKGLKHGNCYTYRMAKLNGTAVDKNGDKSKHNIPQYKFLLDAPFRISHKCCDYMKKKPAKQYEKETGRLPIVATMAEESNLRLQKWLKHGCNAFDLKRPMSAPMSFWSENDVLEYLFKYELDYAECYGKIIPKLDKEQIEGQITIYEATLIQQAIAAGVEKIAEWGANMQEKGGTVITNFVTKVIDIVKELPQKIWNSIVSAVTRVATWGENMQTKAKEVMNTMLTNIVTIVKETPAKIWNSIVSAVTRVATWGNNMLTKAKEVMNAMVTGVITIVKELPQKIWNSIVGAVTRVATWGNNMLTKAKEVMNAMVTGVITIVKELPQKIWNSIVGAVTRVATWGNNMLTKAKEVMNAMVTGIVTIVKEIPQKIYNSISGAITKVATWGTEVKNKAVEGMKNVITGITDVFKNIGSTFAGFGKNMVEGIWNGISGAMQWIKDKISGWVGNVTDFLKDLFGIASPSKLMRDEIGVYLAQGIGVGFSNEIGGVKKMIEDSVPQEFDVDAKVNVGNEFKYDNDDQKPKPRGGGSAAGGVVVNQYIYANTTDYAKQQKEAARQFRMIARTV